MPTVPIDSRRSSPDMPVPSETDLFMALATMHSLGRFKDRLDPSLQGNVEDRRGEGPSGARDEDVPSFAEGAREVAADRTRRSVEKSGDPVMAEFKAMKAKRSAASIGVSGGSR